MTACKSAEVKPIADGAAKNAHSATKIASKVFCATRTAKIHLLVGDTPNPEMTAQRS